MLIGRHRQLLASLVTLAVLCGTLRCAATCANATLAQFADHPTESPCCMCHAAASGPHSAEKHRLPAGAAHCRSMAVMDGLPPAHFDPSPQHQLPALNSIAGAPASRSDRCELAGAIDTHLPPLRSDQTLLSLHCALIS